MTDQLDDLFRDLRAETLTTVRPPGSAAARSTLRRRRRNRAAGAAACLAVAGIGGVGTHLLGPVRTPDVGDRPFRAAMEIGPTTDARFSGQGAATTTTVAQGRVLAGLYTITLACIGRGQLVLSVRTGDAELAETGVWCDAAGTVSSRKFTLADPLTVTVDMRARHGARDHAGYAYTMVLSDLERDGLRRAAAGVLPAATGEIVSKWDVPVVTAISDEVRLGQGSYRLVVACAGLGAIGVRVQAADVTDYTTGASCDGRPLRHETVAFTTTRGGRFVTEIIPDADADRQSSFTFRLERVG